MKQKLLGLVVLLVSGLLHAAATDDFVITVKTDNPGSSSDTQFTIPTASGERYNYNVDCDNDGTDDATGQTGDYTCSYASTGTYTIRVKDNAGDKAGFPRIYFDNEGDKEKILSVNQWGTGKWTSMSYAFYGCSNLNSAPAVNNSDGSLPDWARDAPDLPGVADMIRMFQGASSFNQLIGNWDTSAVTSMRFMFREAKAFNQPIGDWDTSAVTSMRGMFEHASAFDQNLSSWDVTSLTDATYMFEGVTLSTSNYDALLNGWSTQSIKDNVEFKGGNSNYCAGADARQNMIEDHSWTITDGGKDCTPPDPTTAPDLQESFQLRPIKDKNTSKVIGYKEVENNSSVIFDPSMVIDINNTFDGNGNMTVEVSSVLDRAPEGCAGYRAFTILSGDGKVQTGYKGIGCNRIDATSKNNVAFAPGTQARVRPTTLQERQEHGGSEVVIVDDIVVPLDAPVLLGGEK